MKQKIQNKTIASKTTSKPDKTTVLKRTFKVQDETCKSSKNSRKQYKKYIKMKSTK